LVASLVLAAASQAVWLGVVRLGVFWRLGVVWFEEMSFAVAGCWTAWCFHIRIASRALPPHAQKQVHRTSDSSCRRSFGFVVRERRPQPIIDIIAHLVSGIHQEGEATHERVEESR